MAKSRDIILILIGLFGIAWNQISPTQASWFVLGAGIFILSIGIIKLAWIGDEKKKKVPRPMCSFCGYIALDEKELHNHQITCEKKNE